MGFVRRRNTSGKTHKRWRMAFRIAISAGLLALVVSRIDLQKTGVILSQAYLPLVVAMFVVLCCQVVLSAYKLLVLVRCRWPRMTLGRMVRVVLVSLFVGVFFPGTVGTEVARMWGVARQTADRAMSFTAVIMDRLLGLAGLMTVVLAGVLVDEHGILAVFKYWAAGGLILIVAGLVVMMSEPFGRWMDRLCRGGDGGAVRGKIRKVYECVQDFRSHRWALVRAYGLGIAYNLLRAVGIYTGARALGVEAPLSAFLIVIPLTILAVQLPMTIGGFGVRELAYVSMLKLYGVPADAALAISFLQIIVGWTAEILPGAALFIWGRSIQAERRADQAATNRSPDASPQRANVG